MNRAGWGMLSLLALAACGGGYDAEYDCEQSASCNERITGQPVTDTEIEICADRSENIYDGLTDTQQSYLDDVFEACEDEEACAYVVCACDYADSPDAQCEQAREHL